MWPTVAYFGFLEEVSEAASWVLLGVGGHLQDELHGDRLVGHLLHQRLFLHTIKHRKIRGGLQDARRSPICIILNVIISNLKLTYH